MPIKIIFIHNMVWESATGIMDGAAAGNFKSSQEIAGGASAAIIMMIMAHESQHT
ncbi:MAG: hypothetical protein ONB46_02600 [candidate division KSB1 bacterium]|nr:hypothetical protein [candidate division KSB1 bacterium]MDZ7364875.1 hypothetical protein [candidate division KSB1 bacterium]MDZ7402978.1 hypothetical protein [candidate division KSB1 bacterium]